MQGINCRMAYPVKGKLFKFATACLDINPMMIVLFGEHRFARKRRRPGRIIIKEISINRGDS